MKMLGDLRNIIILVLVAVVVWLAMCNKKDVVEKPSVIPTEDQRENVTNDSIRIQAVIDSIRSNELAPALADADLWQTLYNQEKKHSEIQLDILTEFINADCPDTSGRIKAELSRLSARIKATTTACDSTIEAKNRALFAQEKIISVKDSGYRLLRADFDTALAQQDKLQNFIDKTQPKRSLYAGVTVMGAKEKLIYGAGVNLGYRNKKGTMLEVGVMTGDFNGLHYTLGIRKPILSF